MRKFNKIILAMSLVGVSGCASKTSSVSSTTSTSNANVWHVSPKIEADSLKNLAPLSKTTIRNADHSAALIENMNGKLNQHSNNGYTDNVIVLQKEDAQVIYDYDGNLLYTLSTKVSDTYNEEGISVGYAYLTSEESFFSEVYGAKISDSKAIVLDASFKETTEIDASNFIYHPYDGNQLYDDIAIQDGKKGIYSPIRNKSGEDTSSYEFTEFDGYLASEYIAKNVNSKNQVEGTVVATSEGKVLSQIDGELYEKESGMFVNGFVPIYKEEDGTKLIALFNAEDGKQITEYEYTDVGYFQNGYCPIKNTKDKWAYIDEEGNLVTDFIFDEASSLYEGKAWVIKDGLAGVINLKDIVTSEKLSEKDIYSDTETADNPITVDTTTKEDESVIGTLVVDAESINIRKQATTSSDKNGTVLKGETYNVYETTEADSYTWYRIGNDKWIASGDNWVTYKKK